MNADWFTLVSFSVFLGFSSALRCTTDEKAQLFPDAVRKAQEGLPYAELSEKFVSDSYHGAKLKVMKETA